MENPQQDKKDTAPTTSDVEKPPPPDTQTITGEENQEGGETNADNAKRPLAEVPMPGLPQANVDFLYRVFCAKKDMPSLEQLLTRLVAQNPHNPEGGFVFAPPQGMRRLQEALGASKDYFCMGYLREEAPQLFEEAAAVLEDQAPGFDDRDRLTVDQGRLCVVLRAQIKNPPNNEYVETLLHLADTFQDLLDGVVWDVSMRRMWSRQEWANVMPAPMSPLSHVRILQEHDPEGSEITLRTAGLKKFGSADLEICRVPEADLGDTSAFLLDASEHLLQGDLLEPEEVIQYHEAQIRVVVGPPAGSDSNEVLRLVDAPSDPEATFPVSDGSEGAPRLLEAIRAARVEVEGQRAKGGFAAQ